MAKKSRQRKIQGKRPPEARRPGSPLPLLPQPIKPWQIAAVCAVSCSGHRLCLSRRAEQRFPYLRRSRLRAGKPACAAGIERAEHRLGIHHLRSVKLASADLDLATWWTGALRQQSPRPPYNQCVFARRQRSSAFSFAFLYDRLFLARSAMVAFLFALHPAHVESVAWISERKDVLCAFFWFAALLAYAWYVRKPSWKRYLCVLSAALPALSCRSRWPSRFRLLCCCSIIGRCAESSSRGNSRSSGASLFGSYALKNGRCSSWRLSPASSPLSRNEPAERWLRLKPFPCGKESATRPSVTAAMFASCSGPIRLRLITYHESNNINVLAAVLSAIALAL